MELNIENPFRPKVYRGMIACVGNNGGTYPETIRYGFRDAAYILFDGVVKNRKFSEDELVYPIVYCCRHSIELSLKIAIENILQLQKYREEKYKNVNFHGELSDKIKKTLAHHSIEDLDGVLKEIIAVIGDSRLESGYLDISVLLQDYFFDDKGDAFRYARSLDQTPILANYGIYSIAITTLEEKFRMIMESFDYYLSDTYTIADEYSLGTFTKHLSRSDLEEIARELPQCDRWREPEFDDIRQRLHDKYNISGKELSEAISIIKEHLFFGSLIGKEHKIGGISDEELKIYARYSVEMCKLSENEGNEEENGHFTQSSLEKIHNYCKKQNELSVGLSIESISLLAAFSSFGKKYYKCYAERFNSLWDDFKPDSDTDKPGLLNSIQDIELVLKGMERCGQTTYIRKIRAALSMVKE